LILPGDLKKLRKLPETTRQLWVFLQSHLSACFGRTEFSSFITKTEETIFPIPLTAQNCTHVYLIYTPVNNLIKIGNTTCMSTARDVIKKATESFCPAVPPENLEGQPFLHRLLHQLHRMRECYATPHPVTFDSLFTILY